jgi:hypothetical protein
MRFKGNGRLMPLPIRYLSSTNSHHYIAVLLVSTLFPDFSYSFPFLLLIDSSNWKESNCTYFYDIPFML